MHPLHAHSHLSKKLRLILLASFALLGGGAWAATGAKPETSANVVVDFSPILESFEPLA